ncbi:MAG: hypothetical protein WA767_11950, partial [Pseudolabrys sp.]
MTLLPKACCDLQCIDLEGAPPIFLFAGLVQLSVMAPAKGHGELVTDFKTDRPRLRKAQMMRIGRLPSADETRLRGNEFE